MLSRFLPLFNSQEKLSEKWGFLLIFLFPIAGPVVRHWNSLIFVLITFTALYFLFAKKDRKPLYKEEKIYLWVFVLFFGVYIVSVLVNGYSWERIQVEGLGTEINFLLFVPIYLLIREYIFSQKALFAGILLSIPVIFLFSVYEYLYVLPTADFKELRGAYFHLFIGPITALLLLMSYAAYKEWFKDKQYFLVIPIYISMGLFTIVFSQARLAYLTIIGGAIILLFILTKSLKKKITGLILIIFVILSVYQIDIIKQRVDMATKNVSSYFDKNNNIPYQGTNSFGSRLEVLRSTQYIFKESPFIGIGNGNYPNIIQKYIDENLVGHVAVAYGHAHNTFVEVLISKGSLGLILLLMMFYYPVYIASKRQLSVSFVIICTFATAITFISLGESMLINKNNGISYLLIITAVLFSSMIRKLKHNNLTMKTL